VLAFWIVYGLLNAAFRLSVSRTLIIDDARANELTQNLAFGYQIRQPPLYEWILWTAQQVLGTGIESHLFVRYSLIALIGVTTFGAVRAAAKDHRWAAAASLSLAFSYPVGWTFHEWATQTLLLCAACMATMHAAILFLERAIIRNAVLLGAALAFGFYAKFSFPLMAVGLLLAVLAIPDARRKLADPRLLLSLAIAALALSPYGFWVLKVQGDVVSDLAGHLVNSPQSHVVRAGYGLWRLFTSVVTFLLPWIAIVGLLAPQTFMKEPAGVPAASLAEKVALGAMLFGILLAAIGIMASGATNIAARYMHPILFIAPVYVFARAARLAPATQIQPIVFTALIAALVVLLARFIAVTDNPLTREADRGLLMPYRAFAEELAARGYAKGTIASQSVRDVGNLRAVFPQLRVTASDSLRVERPPRREADESCTLIWMAGQDESARRMAGGSLDGADRIEIPRRPAGLFASRAGIWFALRLDPKSPFCR
jgi:hypothetical protein